MIYEDSSDCSDQHPTHLRDYILRRIKGDNSEATIADIPFLSNQQTYQQIQNRDQAVCRDLLLTTRYDDNWDTVLLQWMIINLKISSLPIPKYLLVEKISFPKLPI